MSLCKHGLTIDFVMSMAVIELSSWVESMVFAVTGKRQIDPEVRRSAAKRNTEALKQLRAKNENQ